MVEVYGVFTVALYITFLYRHFPSREHEFLTLQLHWLEGCVVLLRDAILLVWFLLFGTCCLLLKILAKGQLLGKCLVIKFRKSLPMLDVIHLLLGGLNQMIFIFLCLDLAFGSMNSSAYL